MKHRGGKGVTCQNVNEKTGKLAAIITVADDDDIMIITNEGVIIRTSVESVNVYSRTATGVIIMRPAEGSFINNLARLEKAEEIEEASEAIDKEIAAIENEEGASREPLADESHPKESEGEDEGSAEE